jgi:hypothetical protein
MSLRESLRSPRTQRRLLWIGLPVLAFGVAGAIVLGIGDTGSKVEDRLTNEPAVVPVQEKKAPLASAARKAAGEFILTAVARRNLGRSWELTHPTLREGFTRAQWLTGDIPIVPYPVSRTEPSPMSVEESHENSAVMRVALAPEKGSEVKSQIFWIGVRAVGKGADRRWLVDYWAPYTTIPVPSANAS